jgi:hypothetical protein
MIVRTVDVANRQKVVGVLFAATEPCYPLSMSSLAAAVDPLRRQGLSITSVPSDFSLLPHIQSVFLRMDFSASLEFRGNPRWETLGNALARLLRQYVCSEYKRRKS